VGYVATVGFGNSNTTCESRILTSHHLLMYMIAHLQMISSLILEALLLGRERTVPGPMYGPTPL